MAKCLIKKKSNENTYTVTFNLTKGEIDAITNALKLYDTAVAKDIVQYIKNAWTNLGL